MPENPWGKDTNGTHESSNLRVIMNQQGEESDEILALDIHKKINVNPCSSVDTQHSVESDEAFAQQLQQRINEEDNPDIANDALLAAMLQNEIDSEDLAHEDHVNGNCKVRVSSYSGVRACQIEEVSEDTERGFYELREHHPDSSKTKHDKEENSIKNQKKISDNFNIEFKTGDFRDITLPHKVYNELQVEAHKSKFSGIRVKDRRDISTHEQALDKRTRVLMLKMLNSGLVNKINGTVSTGKESVIIHCNGGRIPGKETPVPHECVFKIHKTSLNEFSRRRDYMDRRYTSAVKHYNTKKLIEAWALKEVHNLNRLRRAGIMCPEVVAHRKQLILMSFIGSDCVPAQTLKEVQLSSDQTKSAYQQLLAGMKTMFHKCKLVHADLSPYNLLWHSGVLHFIDLSQAVLTDQRSALTYLYRDCTNMYNYFKSRNLRNIDEPKEMFCDITEFEIEYHDEASFVTRIEHLQRSEVHEFKHGATASDYAFETTFNETLVISSDSEEDEDEEEDEEEEEEEEEEDKPVCEVAPVKEVPRD